MNNLKYISGLVDDRQPLSATDPISVSPNRVISINSSPTFTNLSASTVSASTVSLGGSGGSVAYSKLSISGTPNSGTNGANISTYTTSDVYPLLNFMSYAHSNVALTFDAYYDSQFKSSTTSSNFQIYKLSSEVQFNWNTATAAGSTITWKNGMKINLTNGEVNFPVTTDSTTTANGAVQIKGGASIVKNLYVGGNISCVALTQTSDRRLKQNIVSIDLGESSKKILQLEPKSFEMKDNPGKKHFGLIAQELETVMPELVYKSSDTLSVNYLELIPHLINCIKDQQAQINELRKQHGKLRD